MNRHTEELLQASLAHLGHAIWLHTNNKQLEAIDPTGNEGSEFENKVFEMRSFCWCDGQRHPDGCPPNFKYKNNKPFEVEWYKYLGRGMETNRDLSADEINVMLNDCLKSLKGDEDEFGW